MSWYVEDGWSPDDELSPCNNRHCECRPGRCTHPGFYDARGEGVEKAKIANLTRELDAVQSEVRTAKQERLERHAQRMSFAYGNGMGEVSKEAVALADAGQEIERLAKELTGYKKRINRALSWIEQAESEWDLPNWTDIERLESILKGVPWP